MNIASPEETNVTIGESVAVRNTFKGHLYGAVFEEVMAVAALQFVVRGGLLLEIDGMFIYDTKLHGEVSGFK